MRTTVSLPDALLARAKRRAEEEEVTLSDVVEAALKDHLARRQTREAAPPFRLVTYGRGGLRAGLDYARLKEIADDEEAARLGVGLASASRVAAPVLNDAGGADNAGGGDAPPRR